MRIKNINMSSESQCAVSQTYSVKKKLPKRNGANVHVKLKS